MGVNYDQTTLLQLQEYAKAARGATGSEIAILIVAGEADDKGWSLLSTVAIDHRGDHAELAANAIWTGITNAQQSLQALLGDEWALLIKAPGHDEPQPVDAGIADAGFARSGALRDSVAGGGVDISDLPKVLK